MGAEGQGTAALPVRAKDDEAELNPPSGTGNITVFDDDDDDNDDEGAHVPAAVLPVPVAAGPSDEDDDSEMEDSDDDEAPEALSTQAAASVAKQSSLTAQRAAQE